MNRGNHIILIVDDEKLVAQTTARVLSFDFPDKEILVANDAKEALDILKAKKVAVLLCDLHMPIIDGIVILRKAKEFNPNIVSIVITGKATAETLIQTLNEGLAWKCIEKPWEPKFLVDVVRQACILYDKNMMSLDIPSQSTEVIKDIEPGLKRGAIPVVTIKKEDQSPVTAEGLQQKKEGKFVIVKGSIKQAAQQQKDSKRPLVVPKGIKKAYISQKYEHLKNIKIVSKGKGNNIANGGSIVDKRYTNLVLIKEGGSGAIYKAYDSLLNIPVAIKVIPERFTGIPSFVETLLAEARIAMQLSHKHIVRLHNIEYVKNRYYLVMEYIDGCSFRDLLLEIKRLPMKMVLQIVNICEDALGYAHRRGIYHRDIKPDNMMLTSDGILKIIDFGLACLARDILSTRSEIVGTPYYISREEIIGDPIDQRADIYSLSITIHEFLTGHLPAHIEPELPKSAFDYIPVASDALPQGIRDVLQKGFAVEPKDRWNTIHEFANAFREAFAKLDIAQISNKA